jgi:minor extracellular serine protease Vpr
MKKLYFLSVFSLLSISLWAQQQISPKPKLSPVTKHYLLELKKAPNKEVVPEGFVYKELAGGKQFVGALIKLADASTAEAGLRAIGALTGTKAGNIWTVQMPADKVPEFTEIPGIEYIQLDEPVAPQLSAARKTTRVDSVHAGYGLPMPYSGNGVIMGIIDFGFDYNHPTLYDTMGHRYRVRRVWEQAGTGTPPLGFNYGNEITDSNAIRIHGTDDVRQTHGTGVAGIAAGSGVGSLLNSKLRGMAYQSEMVFVGVRRDAIGDQWMSSGFSDFIDGVNYIFAYSESQQRPAVVNISWGSQSGPHDGTTLFNQACDNLTGHGKILVMSAGNEGEEKIHLSKTFTPSDTVINTFLTFTSQDYKRTWVDIWGEPGKTFCGKATLYSNGVAGNTTGFVCIDDQTHDLYLLGANGDTCYVELITTSSEFNGKPRVTMNIFNKAADSVGISISGTDGTINAWDEYYYYGYKYGYQSAFDSLGQSWAVSGNTRSTVSDMGAAKSVLLVGAYASKTSYTDINGNPWSYSGYVTIGKLVPFSSRGPMIDGRIKPDITAPGLTLATAFSSYDTSYTPIGSNSTGVVTQYADPITGHNFYYGEFSGTSASSPCAAGIVALLLQADPTLTPFQVQDIIATTAITDLNTGLLPASGTNNWGHGKINAYKAIKKVIQQLGVYSFTGKGPDCVLFPNPGNGSFSLDYTSLKDEDISISVTNIAGSLVTAKGLHVSSGNNRFPLDISDQPKGVYIIKVSSAEGMTAIKAIVK